jgi:isopentenyl diphosphate isomerase/L-lactate dehydrogenase-like FMN-dependent dehydrogenase
VGTIEQRWRHSVTRREALAGLAGLLAASGRLGAQQDPRPLKDHRRAPGLDEMMTAFDFEPICFANMTLTAYDYMAHGADSEFTLRRNRDAFDWVQLVEKPGATAASLDTSSELFGIKLDHPILVAPSTRQRDLHPDGDVGMYVGATATRTPMIVASGSSIPIEKIASAANGPRWSQFYPINDLEASREQITRFQDNGARAIVVTVDQQTSVYERDLHDRNLGGTPRRISAGTAPAAQAPPAKGPALYRVDARRMWYSWKYLDDIRPFVKGHMLIKGILTAEDAKICVERGFDGIIVSNHGGRSMDYGPSTLEVLPEIVDAVGGKIPVLVDSGFRRGSDIVKAMAMGASGVCLGRAARWGLGAFGPQGVQRLLEIVQAEFREAMASTGRTSLAALDRTALRMDFT